jgi:ketosteroid isomerase-like protein
MSRENVELVRRAVDAYNRQDAPGGLALFRPDVELDWTHSRGPLKGAYQGHAGLELLWDEYWNTFDDVWLDAHDFIDAGADILVPNTARIRGRDGVEVTADSTFVYTVENGQIVRFRMFQDHAAALEAVGHG